MMQRLKDNYTKNYKDEKETAEQPLEIPAYNPSKHGGDIILDGHNSILVKYAQCCNPLPGDEIVGFTTKGHGISVHKKDCINYRSAVKNNIELGRWHPLKWADDAKKPGGNTYRTTLDIVSSDRTGLLAEVVSALSEMHIPINEMNARELKNGNANVIITVSIAGMEQLNNIITRIKKIEGVTSVDRTGK